MKNLPLVLALLFVFARLASAELPDDGMYIRSEATDARKVIGADEKVYRLGEKCGYEITEAQVISQGNLNREFYLQLKVPFAEGLDVIRHVLVVNGNAYGQASSGSDSNKVSWIGFPISGRENAEAVAAHFGVKPTLREHPGHRLAVSFLPAQKEFDADGAKMVTLRIENVGATPVYFRVGGRNRAARDNQFVFRATDGQKALPDVGSDAHFGGLSTTRELKPGEVFEATVDLSKWFEFGKAGVYFVHGSWSLELFESREGHRLLWEDWATAEFNLTVKERAR